MDELLEGHLAQEQIVRLLVSLRAKGEAVDELVAKDVKFEIYDNVMPGAPKQDDKGILRSPDPIKYGPSIAWFAIALIVRRLPIAWAGPSASGTATSSSRTASTPVV